MKVKYDDITLGMDYQPLKGVGDSGELEPDLIDLLRAIGEAARERETSFILFVDELQYVPEPQLAALISALHQVGQDSLPVTLVGAGLPQLLGIAGRAKSYAERLFEFVLIDRLDTTSARLARARPVQDEGEMINDEAIDEILKLTERYPYFLQEWGEHSWNLADTSPIDGDDAPQWPHLERHDLQPWPRRHSLHCPALRRVHEAGDAFVLTQAGGSAYKPCLLR